ncbi:MAG: manganese efflux pump MntP family protein [Oscillospiraceae bacterium]|nr:manganese efflux pump MntP family protein [Oscillospiraceae bacterium]
MEPYSLFILNSILFGVGLAMDAFSVSMANGLREPDMKAGRMCIIAGTFAFFQILMPLLGWVCVHTIAEMFEGFQRLIPWIALLLLGYIGGKMLLEGLRGEESEPGAEAAAVGWSGLMLQGIATSIDALSVGFTIAEYSWQAALTEALIIGIVTFLICLAGLRIGKFFGMRLAGKASILGGVILIAIGLEIFLTGVF